MLKTIAIISVVIMHTMVLYKEADEVISPLLATVAVPVFIMISAYLRTKKIQKIGIRGAYAPRYMFVSFMSLMLAYVFIVVIEMIGCLPIHLAGHPLPLKAEFYDSVPKFFVWLFTGTLGFGSYYIPIMVELIVVFPLIYMLFIKSRTAGLVLSFLLNGAYDLLQYYLGMHADAYRLLIFRLILMLGFGVYLGLQKEFDKKSDIIAAVFLVIGLCYVIVNAYVYEFTVFGEWATSSMLVAPFAYGYFYFMMKFFKNVKPHKIFILGKASYHIFLVQMLFFFFWGNFILYALFGKLPTAISIPCQIAVSVPLTCTLGYLFYRLETRLRAKLHISH